MAVPATIAHSCGNSFQDAWALCHNETMNSLKFAAEEFSAVLRANKYRVAGDILEAGVWRGGSSCLMTCAQLSSASLVVNMSIADEHERRRELRALQQRHAWLFDTFEGMHGNGTSDSGIEDKKIGCKGSMWGASSGKPATCWQHAFRRLPRHALTEACLRVCRRCGAPARIAAIDSGDTSFSKNPASWVSEGRWNYGPMNVVRHTIAATGLPAHRTHLVKGPVEQTLRGEELPLKLAILRLDTDWYESTKAELEVLWPRLEPGGWLAVDDYYVWSGAKRAVDEWLSAHNWTTAARQAKAFGY
jgi:hypothetical protein